MYMLYAYTQQHTLYTLEVNFNLWSFVQLDFASECSNSSLKFVNNGIR